MHQLGGITQRQYQHTRGEGVEGSGVAWLNQHGLTGLTVPPGDASALAQALQQILDEPGLAGRLGAEARVRYESGFRASQMVDATLALYRRLG